MRKMIAKYGPQKDMTLINHLLFLDDLMFYDANRNQLVSLVQGVKIFSEDIQTSLGLKSVQ